MTPEEIQGMTIDEYRKFRETTVFDQEIPNGTVLRGADGKRYVYRGAEWRPTDIPGWNMAQEEQMRRQAGSLGQKPQMSASEVQALLDAMKPKQEEINAMVEQLQAQADAEKEESERLRLRDELARRQQD